jgi:hypothetical protein
MKTCEICEECEGVTNSRFAYDDEHNGLWVCADCELELEVECYNLECERECNHD